METFKQEERQRERKRERMMEFHREYKDPFTMESAPVNLIIDQQKSQSLPSVVCTYIYIYVCVCAHSAQVGTMSVPGLAKEERSANSGSLPPKHSLVHACETKKERIVECFPIEW